MRDAWVDHSGDYPPMPRNWEKCRDCGDDLILRHVCKSPYWLLHRYAAHHIGPFSTRLDATTAQSVALVPECFEVLTDSEFKDYKAGGAS